MCAAVLYFSNSRATRHKRLDKYANVVALCCQLYFATTSAETPFPNELSLCDIVHWATTQLHNTFTVKECKRNAVDTNKQCLAEFSCLKYICFLPIFATKKYMLYRSTQFAQLTKQLVCLAVFLNKKIFLFASTLVSSSFGRLVSSIRNLLLILHGYQSALHNH